MKYFSICFFLVFLPAAALHAQDDRKIIIIDDETDVKAPKKNEKYQFQGVAKMNMTRFFRGELPVGLEFAPFKTDAITFEALVGPTFRDLNMLGPYDFINESTKLPYKDVHEEQAHYKAGVGIDLGMRLYPSANDYFDGSFLAFGANFRTHRFDANYNLDNTGDPNRQAMGSFKRNVNEFSLCYGYQSEYENFYWESYFGIGVRIYKIEDIAILPDDPNDPLTLYSAHHVTNTIQASSIFFGIKIGWGIGM